MMLPTIPLNLVFGGDVVSSTPPTLDLQNFEDLSGNSRGLTLGGSQVPTFAAGPFSDGTQAVVLNGFNRAVAAGTLYDIPATNYTIEFWFKRNAANNGVTQGILGRWGPAVGGSGQQFLCYFFTDNKLYFAQGTGPTSVNTTAAITDENWHACAIVRDGTSTLKIYIDGVEAGSANTPSAKRSVRDVIAFTVGNYQDAESPYFGSLCCLRISSTARYTSGYTPSTTKLTSDANTVALVLFNTLRGTYYGTPVYQGNIQIRTGFSQASGGFANPDGIFPTADGKVAANYSAYNGSQWTTWIAIANTRALFVAGSATLQASAIQSPGGSDGNIAANGTVLYFGGTYHHWWQNQTLNVKHSTGSSLASAFSAGSNVFTAGVGDYTSYFDVNVRPTLADPLTLKMLFVGQISSTKYIIKSTSTDGSTWTTPVRVIEETHAGFPIAFGEPDELEFSGGFSMITCDGAASTTGAGKARRVLRWADKYRPLGVFLYPTGADAAAATYLSVYDSSSFYDPVNKCIWTMAALSTTTEQTEPTDSDIGLWKTTLHGV